jgi:D-glycero-D-manno-heptose 1,7-bisphosphate phosphatase
VKLMARVAVFLDRDGVLMRDVHQVTRPDEIDLYPYAAMCVAELRQAGFTLVVVTNQPVVAKGLASEADIDAVHAHLQNQLGGAIDKYLFCPHHPNATLPAYRVVCVCRKPRAGMLEAAARELDIDLARSFMIGDRPSDVAAGRRAGCRTVLVETGMHTAPPIEAPEGDAVDMTPDHVCADLRAATAWVLARA